MIINRLNEFHRCRHKIERVLNYYGGDGFSTGTNAVEKTYMTGESYMYRTFKVKFRTASGWVVTFYTNQDYLEIRDRIECLIGMVTDDS